MSAGRIVTSGLVVVGLCFWASLRSVDAAPNEAAPAYRLIFRNRDVQVFDLQMGPGRQAPVRDNSNDLLWVSLDSGIFEFESSDGITTQFQFEAGDVRLFRRHQVRSLRNQTAAPVHSVIVELPRLATNGCGCSSDVERVVCGCSRAGRLPRFWALAIQGATLAETSLDPGQSLKEENSRDDTLLVAIRPLQLRHEIIPSNTWQWIPSKPPQVVLSPGEVEWLPEGRHQLTNVGQSSTRFLTVEF